MEAPEELPEGECGFGINHTKKNEIATDCGLAMTETDKVQIAIRPYRKPLFR
jgi:hypothetical protein